MRILRIILAAALVLASPATFAAGPAPVGLNQLGGSFATINPGAASVTTIIAVATNTKGCWLRTAGISPSVTVSGGLYADTAAPSGAGDVTKRSILTFVSQATAQPLIQPATPLWLPAGIGLFLAVSATGVPSSFTWDCAS